MAAFREHPMRETLANEIRARPYELLQAPARISHLAVVSGEGGAVADVQHVTELCRVFGQPGPTDDALHFTADCGSFRLKWERHTEFSTYTFISQTPFDSQDPFADTFIEDVPDAWVRDLPGSVLAAVHLVLEGKETPERTFDDIVNLFEDNTIAASNVLGGRATVWGDFRIHEDRFSRILVRDIDTNPRQAGRLVQRLLEISTYRLMAMLAFPVARAALPKLSTAEQSLSAIIKQLATITDPEDEEKLLQKISLLAAEVEEIIGETVYRFGAATAYYNLIQRQIEDLREVRIEGLQPPGEFVFRRLRPAMDTCRTVNKRQIALSERIGRAASLLRTRIDVALEKQNRNLLKSMDRRARLQLRLQETVEGLSVAAITYYAVGLAAYLLKAAKEGGAPVNVDISTGIAVPAVAVLVWLGVRHLRKAIIARPHDD